MLKTILTSITLAIIGGACASYLLSYHHGQKTIEKHIKEIETTDLERRINLCNELSSAEHRSPNIAISNIEERIQQINYRKEIRWQK